MTKDEPHSWHYLPETEREDPDTFTQRMIVPGGWLYLYERFVGGGGCVSTTVFVPLPKNGDPRFEWDDTWTERAWRD